MSIKDDYFVQSITKDDYESWLLHKHYAKCIPAIMYSYGLYYNKILVGVCCYGTPANNHNNMLGDYTMIELVRLVIEENQPRNTLSYFVAKTFSYLPSPLALISYSDEGKSHHGYIYQATNWLYTGKGGGIDYYKDITGKEIHSRTMSDYRLEWPHLTRDEIAIKLNWVKEKGTYKHRYFNFIGTKKQKKEMKNILLKQYKQLPYPKGDNVRYDASYQPETQNLLF